MWRLFPKSWFSKSAAKPVRPPVVDDWHACWRARLGIAITTVLKQNVSADATGRVLSSLDSRSLLVVDQTLRYASVEIDYDRSRLDPLPQQLDGKREDIEAGLFTAACHSNGFVRAGALVRFQKFHGRIALTIALIRCDDWVPEVRALAQSLLKQYLDSNGVDELCRSMDLLLTLKTRRRFSADAWPRLIEPTLKKTSSRDALLRSTKTGTANSRIYTYTLLSESGAELSPETYRQAVLDSHPSVAMWALKNCPDSTLRIELLALASRHPNASVRAEVIRQQTSLDPAASLALLESAVLDVAAAPRNAARYLLRQHHSIEAIHYWRDCLDKETGKRAYGALQALAEVAGPEDAGRLRPWIESEKGRVRAVAYRGLLRCDSTVVAELTHRALSDSSTKVTRELVSLWKRNPSLIGRDALRDAFFSAQSDQKRSYLIASARILGKWTSLQLLLGWYANATPDVQAMIRGELKSWTLRQGREFTALPRDTKVELSAQIESLKNSHGDHGWSQYEEYLRFQ